MSEFYSFFNLLSLALFSPFHSGVPRTPVSAQWLKVNHFRFPSSLPSLSLYTRKKDNTEKATNCNSATDARLLLLLLTMTPVAGSSSSLNMNSITYYFICSFPSCMPFYFAKGFSSCLISKTLYAHESAWKVRRRHEREARIFHLLPSSSSSAAWLFCWSFHLQSAEK